MNKMEWIAPCHFGLESVLKREIQDLGYEISQVEDGRVTFYGEADAACRANIFLRTAERVLLKVGSFKAVTFDELFEKTKALPWEAYIPKDGKFWVAKASSVKSKLFSPSDIQSIMKKAMVERLKSKYRIQWFQEDGASYPLRVFLMKDIVTIGIDTSGDSLHKRGYRPAAGKAPISETLAAALIMLTPWRKDRILVDPFCGSGTFPIEAAMMAAKIAPGMNRSFTAETWTNLIGKKYWYEAIDEANDLIEDEIETDIQGYDIDGSVVRMARENAENAGVAHLIHFQERAVKDLRHPKKYGFIITNPPYGERLEDRETLPQIYREFGESFKGLDNWSAYMITSFEDAERYFGRKADKNRKIYNGMLKTYFYQFQGPKPPRQKRKREQKMKKRIIFATGNENKMKEIRMILADLGLEILSMKEAGVFEEIEEDGMSFEENAEIKARAISRVMTNDIVLADDSGLEIDYLDKAPGIYSARFAGEDTSYDIKNRILLDRLEGVPDEERRARFVCAVAAVFPDGTVKVVRETIEGQIAHEIVGENGFGYDPIFYVPEYGCTTAEMTPELKNELSHRGKALRAMKKILEEKFREGEL